MDIKILASGSTGNCYRISDGSTALLLDAGIPIKRIRIGCDFRLRDIAGCLITHSHGDHSKAAAALLAAGANVWMPRGEADALSIQPHHRLHVLSKNVDGDYASFAVGTLNVLPVAVEHDTPEPVGYLIGSGATGEKLLYFTDTFFLRYRFTGLTHIIGECNYDRETLWDGIDSGEMPASRAKRLFRSHMSLDNFLSLLQAADRSRLRQIYICHMSDDNGNETKIKDAVQRLTGVEVYIC